MPSSFPRSPPPDLTASAHRAPGPGPRAAMDQGVGPRTLHHELGNLRAQRVVSGPLSSTLWAGRELRDPGVGANVECGEQVGQTVVSDANHVDPVRASGEPALDLAVGRVPRRRRRVLRRIGCGAWRRGTGSDRNRCGRPRSPSRLGVGRPRSGDSDGKQNQGCERGPRIRSTPMSADEQPRGPRFAVLASRSGGLLLATGCGGARDNDGSADRSLLDRCPRHP